MKNTNIKRLVSKRNARKPDCKNCANLIPIGEGDHICDAEPGRMPLSEYLPTEDYLWCGGRQFCGK